MLKLAFFYLMLMGIFSLVLAHWIYPDKLFQIQEKEKDELPVKNDGSISRRKRRHLTGDSNTGSVCSATTSFFQDVEGPENMKMRSLFCVVMSAVVVTPAILAITFYKFLPATKFYVMDFNQNADNIVANLLGVTEGFGLSEDLGLVKSEELFITNNTRTNLDSSNLTGTLI